MNIISHHFVTLHRRLQKQLHQLEADLHHFETWRLSQLGYGNALVDDSGIAFDQATQLTLRHNTERRLSQVKQALRRLEAGHYGICEGCSEFINVERLLAAPHARLCITCQQISERSPLGRMSVQPHTETHVTPG
ncbi:MAG: TraR/DksA family transcriptional regulator [Proteobacteria bacterium]|nr:TraR/DksA family transcriptional regulator [Pseudomonadota bacterium]